MIGTMPEPLPVPAIWLRGTYTLAEAAELTGIGEHALRHYADDGRLVADRAAGRVTVGGLELFRFFRDYRRGDYA